MSFPNITLLECNRLQSTQKGTTDDNNAIFTNRMGDVVSLDVGDTVEVKSAFINKRGSADPNSIEFKGQPLGVEVDFNRTSVATEQPTEYSLNNHYPQVNFISDITSELQTNPTDPDVQNNFTEQHITQTHVAFRQIFNESVSKGIRDNEMYLETQLYKNSNGECYCFQPRNYLRSVGDLPDSELSDNQLLNIPKTYFCRPNFDMDYSVIHSGVVLYKKGKISGITRYSPDDSYYTGRGLFGFDNYKNMFLREDYGYVAQATTYSGTATHPEPDTKADFEVYVDVQHPDNLRSSAQEYNELKPKNDNSRYFLFEREYDWMIYPEEPVENTETGQTPEMVPNYVFIDGTGNGELVNAKTWFAADTGNLPDGFPVKYLRNKLRSPALFNYLQRTKLNHVTVDTGYSTPQSISEQVTTQLQSQENGSPYIYDREAQFEYTTAIKTGYYEPIMCADFGYNLTNYRNYFDVELGEEEPNDKLGFEWWRSFHHVMIKRPDLYIAGTKINNWYGFVGTPEQQSATPPEDPRDPSDNAGFGIGNYIWNDIDYNPRLLNNWTDPIQTGWLYTEDNLRKLSELFDVQGQHPELFYDESKGIEHNRPFTNAYYPNITFNADGSINTYGDLAWGEPATIDNSRFLHINRFNINNGDGSAYTGGNRFNILGDDGFLQMTYTNGEIHDAMRTFDTDHRATAFFFKYDKTYRNIDTGGDDTSRLSYGFATRELISNGSRSDYYIVLHPELVNGLRPEIFNLRGGMQPFTNPAPSDPEKLSTWDPAKINGRSTDLTASNYTMIGWDYHFSSWGNVVMTGTTGMPFSRQNYDGTFAPTSMNQKGFLTNNEGELDQPSLENIRIDTSYLGANDLALQYDTVSNKFGWEYLHRPETVGNKFDAGSTNFTNSDATPTETIPINDNAGDEVIKINPRTYKWSWCAEMVPYIKQNGELDSSSQGTTRGRVDFEPMNPNLSTWVLYDSKTGCAINFGKTAKIDTTKYPVSQTQIWNQSLLGILGFTYEQFNPKEISSNNNSLARIDNRNVNSLYNPTTNANFFNTNVNDYVVNEFGATQYTTQLPYGMLLDLLDPYSYKPNGFNAVTDTLAWTFMPAINLPAQSIKIEGDRLPRVSLNPYVTIRSDLMRPQKYIGGLNSGLSLPVCAIVNQINTEKDYLQLEGSEVYTITAPMKFSSITTMITDPDGTLSLLDEGSCVIYKITKADNIQKYDILEDFKKMLNEKK